MIRLNRPAEPFEFQSTKLLREKHRLQELFNQPNRQERLRFDSSVLRPIKEYLGQLSGGKCAYCESTLGGTQQMNVDAFRPKDGSRDFKNQYSPDHYWWLAYEWTNLLPSCSLCNHNKRDWFPIEGKRASIGVIGNNLLSENALLIDPCHDSPEEHFEFTASGQIKSTTNRGQVTIEILGLNRPYLIEERKAAWQDTKDRLGLLETILSASKRTNPQGLNFIHELSSPLPPQNYIATRRQALLEWAEQQPSLWDKLRTTYSLPLLETISLPTHKAVKEDKRVVQQVERKLSELKRFSIKRIEIKNFKSIAELNLEVMPPYENEFHESWLLLLGDNGVGKSSILQAVALALTGESQLEKLNISAKDILQRGKRKGWVKVYSHEHPDPIELAFDANTITGGSKQSPTFLLAYGSTRLLPKGRIRPEKTADRYTKISNLFDYSVALNSVESWLNQLKEEEFNQRVAPALFDLLALKKGDRLSLKKGKLVISQFDEEFSLEDISDGYKNIIALASDIMQMLSVDQVSYHATQGIVLIDELGNHLHPRWRMKIVDSLRRTFPNLQFIVTTHEPLCLRGLAHGEVIVLLRDKQHHVRALDKHVLPDHNLLRVDQLLTSDLFGLVDTLDPRLEKTYDDYYALLSKKERSQDEEQAIVDYKKQLPDKQILGSTPQQQIYYELIEETYAKNLQENGFKTIEQLKHETLETVRDMLKNDKKLDWL